MNTFKTIIKGVCLTLAADSELFSPDHADQGTLAMLSIIDINQGQKLLDLGCGYGIVGIYAAGLCGQENVWMLDKSRKAIDVSRINATANGYDKINILLSDGPEILIKEEHRATFDWILSNPPYHEDFSVARRFIETSEKLLKNNGKLVMVVKRLDWYKNKLRSVFGGVKIHSIDGYYVLISEKRLADQAGTKAKPKKKTTTKHMKKVQRTKKTHHSIKSGGVNC